MPPRAGALLVSIVQKEGVGALFRGALPRALWVAPVGAMNFAGAVHPAQTLACPSYERGHGEVIPTWSLPSICARKRVRCIR